MHRFYVKDSLNIGRGKVDIKGNEVRHMRDVLRLKSGDDVALFDGLGHEFRGRIEHITRDSVSLDIIDAIEKDTESPLEIVLGQGLPKSDKMELIIQKSTELGVSRIVPIITERVVLRSFNPGRLERWERIAVEACKQCGRVRPPIISEPVSISEFLGSIDKTFLRLVPWEKETVVSLKDSLPSSLEIGKISFLVGPEGGLSEDEVLLASKSGYIPVSLGKRILRTETVSLTLLSILQFLYGDLS